MKINILHDLQLLIAGCLFLLGTIQLAYRNSGALNRNLATAFFSLGYVLLYLRSLAGADRILCELFPNTENVATLFSGTAIYFTISTIICERRELPKRYYLHYAVPTFSLLALLVGNALTFFLTGKSPEPWDYTVTEHGFTLYQILSLLTNVYLFAYIIATIVNALEVRRKGLVRHTKRFALLFALLCFLSAMVSAFIVTCFVSAPIIIGAFANACGLLVIVFGVLGFRYPEYIQRVLKTVSGQNKRKETLERMDMDSMMAMLVSLMEKGKIYRNPNLTVDDVGGYMNLGAQMVSELINRKTGTNFRSWLNAWRIQAICIDLEKRRHESILNIALKNGFNSKSAFNTAFQEITGKTPREFRKALDTAKSGGIRQTLKLPSFVKSSVAK